MRNHRGGHELPLPGDEDVLGKFLQSSFRTKESARHAWAIFKQNPFDTRLRAHKIHRLSALMRRTVYAVEIEGDLRAVFYVDADVVISFNIGTHDIYNQ